MSRGPDPYLPHCFGHEAVGEVLEVGDDVIGLSVGDRVIISWMKASADCHEPPKFTEESGADVNFGQCCTFVTRGVFPENRVFKIDESIASDVAALLGCALLTAYAALKCATSASKGDKSEIAIVGAGGIGLSVAALCQAFGWSAICVDTPAVITHLEMQDLGFQFTSTAEATVQRAGKHPIVIVCTGAHSAFEVAETLLPRNAGKLLVVGNPPYGTKVGLDIKPLLYGREIIGVGEKDIELPKDLHGLIDLLKTGRLQAEQISAATISPRGYSSSIRGVGFRPGWQNTHRHWLKTAENKPTVYSDRRVLITGASRGVGAALTEWLADNGADVLAVGRSKENLSRGRVEYLALDLSSQENTSKLVEHATEFEPDTVVHALGGGFGLSNDLVTPDDFLHLVQLNFLVSLQINNSLLPNMVAKKQGWIVHLGTVAKRGSSQPRVTPALRPSLHLM